MDPLALEKPFLDGGIRTVNFFNGRLLTAKDLSREQEARRLADERLGRAIGEGVAYGLEVLKHSEATAQDPLVTVKPGLAVNRAGQTLCLTQDTTVALVRKSKLAAAADTTFAQCGPLQSGTYVAGPGVYLLTIAPATMREGRAPTSGFNQHGGACNTDAIVETVQFRLISLESELADLDLTNEDMLRNRIAYRCFGVEALAAFRTDPFGPALKSLGPLDELRNRSVLTACDVPLALFYWTLSRGIRFLDNWAVRRRVTATAKDRSFFVNDRRRAEGEAMFLQFQDHVEAMRTQDNAPQSVQAKTVFRYLPPAGLIPIHSVTSPRGFDYLQFFQGIKVRNPAFVEGSRVETILRNSAVHEPIDLSSGELIWIYRIRQNMESIAAGADSQPSMIFVTGHAPYYGDAHYQVNRWNYSNYL